MGIGSASAIFTVVDRVLFRRLPYPAPQQLVTLGYQARGFDFLEAVQPIELAAYRERATSVASFAALRRATVNLVDRGEPAGVNIGYVPADYLGNFGAIPLLGRTFVAGEDQPGADRVLVLTYKYWKERFGGDPGMIGRDVLVGNASCRIVGVLAADFTAPRMHYAQAYCPLVLTVNPAQPFGMDFAWVIARLRPGVSLQRAQAELGTIKVVVSGRFARVFAERVPQLRPLAEPAGKETSMSNWMMLAAVGLLYAIGCANAANLTLARLCARRKELCVRLAMGCGRARLLRLVMAEMLLLTLTAGAGGLLVARWALPALQWLIRSGGGEGMSLNIDGRVLVFTAAVGVLTCMVVCVPAAWQIARSSVVLGLKDGAQTVGESRGLGRVRSGLVVFEAALAVVLLIGTGLMLRTAQRLRQFDRGFDPTHKASLLLTLPPGVYSSVGAQREFLLQVDRKLHDVPGVQAVSMATVVPLSNASTSVNITRNDGSECMVGWNAVMPEYRAMLGLPMVKGRWFDGARPTDAPVVVINETMARQFFGDANPIGRPFTLDPNDKGAVAWQVVGVVRDLHTYPRQAPEPEFYVPFWQMPRGAQDSQMLLLRLGKPIDAAMNDAVRRAIYSVNPIIATLPLRPLSDAINEQMSLERDTLTVLKTLSGLALVLAVMGLFAVMVYGVAQRMGEFGVRMALGALPSDLFRLVLMRGTVLMLSGVAIGCGAGWAATKLIGAVLFQTSPLDPMVYGAVALILLAAGLLGCLLPATRAMRADVARLLRAE
jgi:putative ABC transport system permease protein